MRWARAAGFAVVCAGLAAFGHSLAGGQVGRLALAACAVLVFLPALALTGREHSIKTILPAVAACQVGLHLLLSHLRIGQEHTAARDARVAPGGHRPVLDNSAMPGGGALAKIKARTVTINNFPGQDLDLIAVYRSDADALVKALG